MVGGENGSHKKSPLRGSKAITFHLQITGLSILYMMNQSVSREIGFFSDAIEDSADASIGAGPGVSKGSCEHMTKPSFTLKQGQYLAFIYNYTKINGQPPAERDMQRYFQTTPPSVHDMILRLEQKGLIERTPGKARSVRLLISPENLPPLK